MFVNPSSLKYLDCRLEFSLAKDTWGFWYNAMYCTYVDTQLSPCVFKGWRVIFSTHEGDYCCDAHFHICLPDNQSHLDTLVIFCNVRQWKSMLRYMYWLHLCWATAPCCQSSLIHCERLNKMSCPQTALQNRHNYSLAFVAELSSCVGLILSSIPGSYMQAKIIYSKMYNIFQNS